MRMIAIRRFIRSAALAVVVATLAARLGAQAPGTPEHYVKEGRASFEAKSFWQAAVAFRQATMLRPDNAEYHFLLGAALASDRQFGEARTAFARAVELNPELRPQADAWLAGLPSQAAQAPAGALPAPPPRVTKGDVNAAAPATPAAPAAPAGRAAGGAGFAPGSRVEVEYTPGRWIPGVVVSVSGVGCPAYRVRADAYGRGDPSELVYFCGSVRAPTGVAPVQRECGGSNPNCPPTSPPPAGVYGCTEQVWQGPGANPQYRPRLHGSIRLLSGGRYQYLDGGEIGRYAYDRRTHRIRFIGGGLADRGTATYGLDGKTPEITIAIGERGANWQCGLQ